MGALEEKLKKQEHDMRKQEDDMRRREERLLTLEDVFSGQQVTVGCEDGADWEREKYAEEVGELQRRAQRAANELAEREEVAEHMSKKLSSTSDKVRAAETACEAESIEAGSACATLNRCKLELSEGAAAKLRIEDSEMAAIS